MPKPKFQKSVLPNAASTSDAQASSAVIIKITEMAKKSDGADVDLLAILEKHVLKTDPKDNASEAAVSEIDALARKRANPPHQKT